MCSSEAPWGKHYEVSRPGQYTFWRPPGLQLPILVPLSEIKSMPSEGLGCPSVGVTPTWWEFLEDDSAQLPCKAPGASGLPRLRCHSWVSPGSASARPAAAGCLAHFTPPSSLRLLPPAVIPQTATVNVPRESIHICPSRCPLRCPQK